MFREALSITKKDIKHTFRSKQTLAFMILFPVVFMLILGYIFGQEQIVIVGLGVVDEDQGQFSEVLIDILTNATEIFKVTEYNVTENAIEQLEKGNENALLVIPEDFSTNITLMKQVSVNVYIDVSDPNTAQLSRGTLVAFLKEFSKQLTEARIDFAVGYLNDMGWDPLQYNMTLDQMKQSMYAMADPIIVGAEDVSARRVSYVEWMVPGITIGTAMLWIGIGSSTATIADEREKGTLRRILLSPTSAWSVLLGKAIAIEVEVLVTAFIGILVGIAVYNISLNWALHLTVPIIVLTSLNSIGLGLIFSSVARSAKTAGNMATFLSLPLQFFIGMFFPVEMFGIMKDIMNYLPWTQGLNALRAVMIRNATLNEIAPALGLLTATSIIIFTIGVIAYNWAMKRL